MCKQNYHGVVYCALGWACWKTYAGRPEAEWTYAAAMNQVGLGLTAAHHHEDALPVREAELSMMRRFSGHEDSILRMQANLANSHYALGRTDTAIQIEREVYSGYLKLHGEENRTCLMVANNYANSLLELQRFEEAKSVLRKTIPTARRILGENAIDTLKMRVVYAQSLYRDPAATLDDLREAETTLTQLERTSRRVLGGAHPVTVGIEKHLRRLRIGLGIREMVETPPGS